MVCKSEDSGTEFHHSDEMEHPTETSAFLRPDNSDRRPSNTLSILVLSEGIPIDPEKVPFDIAPIPVISPAATTTGDPEDRSASPKKKSCCRNYAGIWLTLSSGLAYTLGGVIVKYMKDYHPFTLALFRFQGILIPSLVMALYAYYVKKLPIFEPIWPLTTRDKAKRFLGMICRCVFGTAGLFLHFYALKRIDLADTLVIGSCQTVFVTIAAYFFLGEACGVFPVVAALLSIVGVGVISRPPILTGQEDFDEEALAGAAYAISGMLAATIVVVFLRYLKDVHVSILTLVLGIWGTILSIVCALIVGEFKLPHDTEHWLLAIGLGLSTLLGQVGFTLAIQCEMAGPVTVVRTADCITAFLLQFLLLGVVPDLYSLIGASIIIFCVILTTIRKWISTLPQDHSARKSLWFIMV